ncbi:MAG: beta-propeller fold lactonase family protein [Bryobacteraceae bacterium]
MSPFRVCLVSGSFFLAGSWNCLFPQLVYVPNQSDGTVSTFIVNAEAGTLTEVLPRIATPGRPNAVAAEPRGKFIYTANAGDAVSGPNIAAFRIDPDSGALEKVPGAQYSLGGNPIGVKVDPEGKFLYVANQGGGNIVGFALDASSGALTRVPGTPSPAGGSPSGLTVEPSGKYLYATNQSSNNISAYRIDANTGALTAIPGSPFTAGRGPSRLAADPAGKFLYVTNQGGNSVSVYAIDPGSGALAAVKDSPFAAGAGPTAVAVDPSGKFAIVANGDDDTVSVYAVDANNGSLSPVAGSPFTVYRAPFDVLADPAGKYVYVTNLLDNNVSSYLLDGETGALSLAPGAPFASGRGPQRAALVRPAAAIHPPVIARAALNAASYAPPGTNNYGVARGSTFAVLGQNLGPAAKVKATAFPLPRQLASTSVKVTVGDFSTDAVMVSTSIFEVLAILPSDTPSGDGTVTVTYNGRSSAGVRIRVVDAVPGIFTVNGAGTGPAVAHNYVSDQSQPANGLTEAAHPGQKMFLLGTGLGPVAFDETRPAPAANLRDDVEVWVGNKRAAVSYSGRSTDYPGIDQVIFTLPDDAPVGCYVPLAIKLGTPPVASNFATIAVTPAEKICSDPHGLSSVELAKLDGGGALNVGWIQAVRVNVSATIPGLGTGAGLVDSAWGEFFRWDAGAAARDQGLDLFTGRGVSLGGCAVHVFQFGGAGYIPMRANFLNGGSWLNMATESATGRLVRTRYRYYEAHKALGVIAPPGINDRPMPPPFLEPGTVRVDNGAGGPDVAPFQARLSIPASPAPLDWTNLDAIAAAGIDRSTDLTFRWSGGDPAGEYVIISGAVALPSMISKDTELVTAFVCTEKAGAGTVTIPAVVLSTLPASNPEEPMSGILMAGRAPLLTDGLKFTASGLDIGYLSHAVFSGRLARYR